MKAKYRTLRTYYVKEHKKVEKSSKSGAGAAEVYVPKWPYYSALNFLATTVEINATESSIIDEIDPLEVRECQLIVDASC